MKVTLRDVVVEDLPIFFAHQSDPVAAAVADFASRDWQAFDLHWRIKILGDPRGGKQTVLVDGVVAGNIVSWDSEGQRRVGYWIGREFWRRGVATAALAAYLIHERVRPLHADVAGTNLGSVRVLQKCGFIQVTDEEFVLASPR